jgi:chromate transporter
MLITSAAAYAYVQAGARPELTAIFYAVKPVVAAIVVHAIAGLAPVVLPSRRARVIAALALAAVFARVHELAILVACGVVHAGFEGATAQEVPGRGALASPTLAAAGAGAVLATKPVTGAALFGTFAKIGSVLYGSGYVLVAFLRSELVERLGWISEAQLLDAVAVGQATPGPVFTTATFLGFLLGGVGGALAATAGIFAPAFFFVTIADPLTRALSRSRTGCAFLAGVNVASLALMVHVAIMLARTAVVDALTLSLAAGAAFALLTRRATATQLLACGALVGLAQSLA